MDWYSLILPVAYLTILVTSLYTFSYLYRRRQAQKALSLQPWFPAHTTRNIYASLLELQSNPTPNSPKVPDTILRAALLRRAVTDIHRLLSLRNSKPALAQLLQRGSVGDELWQRFLVAEKEMEVELREVVEEANALAAGWGQVIFQSANEIAGNELLRKKLKEIEERRAEEKERWAERRDTVREGFMKELDDGQAHVNLKEIAKSDSKADGKFEQSAEANAKDATREIEEVKATPSIPLVPTSTTSVKTGSGDEDAVLVEREPNLVNTPDPSTPLGTGGSGSAKKKKGKK